MATINTNVISKFLYIHIILVRVLVVYVLIVYFRFRCKKLVSARKQMSILQAPNVLVIQLKVIVRCCLFSYDC